MHRDVLTSIIYMPIVRDYTPKDVLYLGDYPLVKEEQSGKPFSEFSHSELKQGLMSGSVRCYMAECLNIPVQQVELSKEFVQEFTTFEKTLTNPPKKYILGINQVNYTYLSNTRPEKGDTDWLHSIVNKKGIPEGKLEEYTQCEWLKDIWVTTTVYQNILETIHQIKKVNPKIIICGGKWAFLFLATLTTEQDKQLATIAGTKATFKKQIYFGGLNKYRASILTVHSYFELPEILLVPILSPTYHWVVKDKVRLIRHDYSKIASFYGQIKRDIPLADIMYSKREHKVGLTFNEVHQYLTNLLCEIDQKPTRVVFDTETRQYGIDCIGICYKEMESFTIPITEVYHDILEKEEEVWVITDKKEERVIGTIGQSIRRFRHYWDIEDEVNITDLLHKIMLHPNCLHIGQNYSYDCTFYFRQWLLYINSHCDTMTLQHVLYNCDPKKLDYLASIYSPDYTYWKNERNTGNNMERWVYCGKDCCHNYTVDRIMNTVLKSRSEKLQEFYNFQQFCMLPATFDMSLEGVSVDIREKDKQYSIFHKLVGNAVDTFHYLVGEAINLNSSVQVKRFFKDLMGIKPIAVGKTKESFGAAACKGYLVDYPHLKYAITLLLEYKSLKIFVTNFLGARVDKDGKMRCSVNLDATKTYRCSMSKNLDGGGVNMQTIPEKGKIDIEYALAILGEEDEIEEEIF